MKVSLKDGSCRSCGGELEITDADDVTMTVACQSCQEEYPVEHDAFSDGGMHYVMAFLAQQPPRLPHSFAMKIEGPRGTFWVEGDCDRMTVRPPDHALLTLAKEWCVSAAMADFDPADKNQTRFKLRKFRLSR